MHRGLTGVRLSAVLLPLMLLALTETAGAGTATLTPPYADSLSQHSCAGVCSSDASADPATGDLTVDLSVVAPPSSTPAQYRADAYARIVAAHTVGARATSVAYTVSVHVAEAVAEGGITFEGCGNAEVSVSAWALHDDCPSCATSVETEVVAIAPPGTPEPVPLPPRDVAFALTLTNRAGGPVPEGTIRIFGRLTAIAYANFTPLSFFCHGSQAIARGLATVTNISASWNSLPTAADDAASGRAGFPVKIGVLANDSDLDGDSLTVTAVTDPPNGSTVVNADNTVTYDPDGCFVGTNTFSYTISDGNGGTDTGVVSVRMRQTSRRSSIGC